MIQIACKACALENKARSCPHPKSSVTLFSDTAGSGVLAGGQYAQGHFDEQIQHEFFTEGKQRIKTVPNSGIIVTETPLYGRSWWTYGELVPLGKKGAPENLVPGTDKPLISLHSIDQFSAGLVPHERILADMKTMTEPEIEARIYGKHIAANEMAVFDLQVLYDMRSELRKPQLGVLELC
jgi:hypothetical protein